MSAVVQRIGLNLSQAQAFEKNRAENRQQVIELSPTHKVVMTGKLSPCFMSQALNSEGQRYKCRNARERLKEKFKAKQLAKLECQNTPVLGIDSE